MINVIGLGYIGLPTALMLASHGNEVIGTDINTELVSELNNGKVTFEERGLQEIFDHALNNKIVFSDQYVKADIYLIAVPTPYDKISKKIDPKYVVSSVESVLTHCDKGAIIIIESTISPGTIEKYIRPVIESYPYVIGEDIHIVHAPERIIPGNMIHELESNSRTIGCDSVSIGEKVKKIYETFCRGEIVITDIRTAEMTKVVENTFRDINIAYANELAKICRSDDMDVYEIIRIANKHPRVQILSPGPGVGGHCISVDPWFLVGDYPGLANIILAARKINDSMPEFVIKRIHNIMIENGLHSLSQVGLYGLTYKENVDDIRESPTLQLIECLENHLAFGVKVYDPWVKGDIVDNQFHNFNEFYASVKLIVIMVNHACLKDELKDLKSKLILDTKHTLHVEGIYYL